MLHSGEHICRVAIVKIDGMEVTYLKIVTFHVDFEPITVAVESRIATFVFVSKGDRLDINSVFK